MAAESQFRCDVAGLEALAALRKAALPLGLRAAEPVRTFHRDIYLDTPDRSLLARGVTCRIRIGVDDRRWLTLFLGPGTGATGDAAVARYEAAVPEADPRRALEQDSEPARRLRGLLDPAQLKPRVELEVDRWQRRAAAGFLRRTPRFGFLYDQCTVRHGGLTRVFEELQVRRMAPGRPSLARIAEALERQHGLVPLALPRHERAAQLAGQLAAESAARLFSASTTVVLLALQGERLAFRRNDGSDSLPAAQGSGEAAARHLLTEATGSAVGQLALLGTLPASEDRDALEIWVARRLRVAPGAGLEWVSLGDAIARIGTPVLRAPETLAALAVAVRAGLLERPSTPGPSVPLAKPRASRPAERPQPRAERTPPVERPATLPPDHFLNPDLSQLAFQERVLELARDRGTPLAERMRFLAIVSANLDEFFSVRVGALQQAAAGRDRKRSLDGLSAREQLDAIAVRAPSLIARQSLAARECLGAAAAAGLPLRTWDTLDPAERELLATRFAAELLPLLTPRALTQAPGHPFPVIPHLVPTFGVMLRDPRTGPVHFAALPLRGRLERLLEVPGGRGVILLEEVVRAQLQAFYRDRVVEGAWLFRITRAAELALDDQAAGDLLQAVEEDVRRRAVQAPVRLELERGMPERVRELLLRELRFERRDAASGLGPGDVYELDPPLDLTLLRDLAGRLSPLHSYPPARARDPFPATPGLLAQIEREDLLVHHPYDDFGASVGRFLEEAAADPDVVALKLTLYRVGDRSPIVDALLRAAERGKDVAVFVELQARFDEARNIGWVRRLEDAGAQVIYGLVGHKIHAKVALVVRRTPDGLRRYAHLGTGNYNASTSRFYTDYGLFTCDPELTADLTDLFNHLTGSAGAPQAGYRRLLVAPASLLPGLLERIEREIAHAGAGREGLIRAQLNGLEDPEVVAALYRAASAGVRVELVVRSLCVLRPGIPGVSAGIRVVSVLGRLLEHGRIYQFGNGGAAEYFIGSADWRPRNLRRRVEVVTPVRAPGLVARLDAVLTALLAEPAAWRLADDGTYARAGVPSAGHVHLHERFFA